jgi:hypothetical protein
LAFAKPLGQKAVDYRTAIFRQINKERAAAYHDGNAIFAERPRLNGPEWRIFYGSSECALGAKIEPVFAPHLLKLGIFHRLRSPPNSVR